MDDVVIAVDPGREKCGLAVVGRTGKIFTKAVVATGRMPEVVAELAARHRIATVVLGNRTGSRAAAAALSGVGTAEKPLAVRTMDEHLSTDQARARYWRDNPPRGLARLVPVTLRVPPVPVDDYVAVILAERYFAENF
jgi:RNase H-fold protein (predicted Holliday junction resolvase)